MRYDVFISFKKTDEKGKETHDAQIGRDLFDFLKKWGVNVFFSDEEVKDSNFSKSIFKALKDAKVMFIIGTKREYLEAKWIVKEYDTFFETQQTPQVFCVYEGVKDLPDYLKSVQAFDYKSDTFYDKVLELCLKNEVLQNNSLAPNSSENNKATLSLKKYYYISIVLISGGLLFAGFYNFRKATTFETAIVLVDSSGKPIKNRAVQINNNQISKSGVTDANGQVLFKDLPIESLNDSVNMVCSNIGAYDNTDVPFQKTIALAEHNTVFFKPVKLLDEFAGEENETSQISDDTDNQSIKPKMPENCGVSCDLDGVSFIAKDGSMYDKFVFAVKKENVFTFSCKAGIYEVSGEAFICERELIFIQQDFEGVLTISDDCTRINGAILIGGSKTSKFLEFVRVQE